MLLGENVNAVPILDTPVDPADTKKYFSSDSKLEHLHKSIGFYSIVSTFLSSHSETFLWGRCEGHGSM